MPNENAVKEKCVTISGEGIGDDSLEELGEFKSDEFSPACFTETVTWEKIINLKSNTKQCSPSPSQTL